MKHHLHLLRLAAVFCCLAITMSTVSAAVTPSNVGSDGMISADAFNTEAEDFDGIDQDFLDYVSEQGSISVSELKSIAGDYSLPAKYLQRFVDDSFVIKAGSSYNYYPIDKKLAKNDYDFHNLVQLDNGFKDYVINDESQIITGVDVSQHQGDIDWESVYNDGIRFAFIRLGNRGYQTGKLSLDEKFYQNLQNARAAGIKVGVYFYSQARNYKEGVEEANFVIDALKGYKIDFPVVFDVEGAPSKTARTYGISKAQLTNACLGFCKTVAAKRYRPMIYTYTKVVATELDMTRLKKYPKWIAMYYAEPFYPYEMSIWQYTSSGYVDGIDGRVDLNMEFLNGANVKVAKAAAAAAAKAAAASSSAGQ